MINLEAPQTSLRVMKRRLDDADVYLLFNEGPQPFTQKIDLQSRGKQVEQWAPQQERSPE